MLDTTTEDDRGGAAAAARATPDADVARADADRAAADAAASAAVEDEPGRLGPRGEAALDAERRARRDAERRARTAEAEARRLRDASLSETERLKQEAEQGREAAAKATEKLRKANLITALADKGLTGAKAKAAARLLDGVEYDDEDEPTNLDDAIRSGIEEYGADAFKGVKARAPDIDPGGGGGGGDRPSLTADELAAAKALGQTPEEYAAEKNRYA